MNAERLTHLDQRLLGREQRVVQDGDHQPDGKLVRAFCGTTSELLL